MCSPSSCPGRCAPRLKRRGRCLDHLGPASRLGPENAGRPHPGRRHGRGQQPGVLLQLPRLCQPPPRSAAHCRGRDQCHRPLGVKEQRCRGRRLSAVLGLDTAITRLCLDRAQFGTTRHPRDPGRAAGDCRCVLRPEAHPKSSTCCTRARGAGQAAHTPKGVPMTRPTLSPQRRRAATAGRHCIRLGLGQPLRHAQSPPCQAPSNCASATRSLPSTSSSPSSRACWKALPRHAGELAGIPWPGRNCSKPCRWAAWNLA